MPITSKNNVLYKCTLRHYPHTETFFVATENPSTPRASNAVWVERARRTTDFPEALAGQRWLLFYKNHQLWPWILLIGLLVGAVFMLHLLAAWANVYGTFVLL